MTASLLALRARIRTLAGVCEASVEENEIYPGWNPAPKSQLVTTVKGIYTNKFDLEPKLTAIHAGLEVRFQPDAVDMLVHLQPCNCVKFA